jgi:hypothetical protein
MPIFVEELTLAETLVAYAICVVKSNDDDITINAIMKMLDSRIIGPLREAKPAIFAIGLLTYASLSFLL